MTEIISEFQSISESISGLATTVSDECCTAVAAIIKAWNIPFKLFCQKLSLTFSFKIFPHVLHLKASLIWNVN